jgi:hypothetical protein
MKWQIYQSRPTVDNGHKWLWTFAHAPCLSNPCHGEALRRRVNSPPLNLTSSLNQSESTRIKSNQPISLKKYFVPKPIKKPQNPNVLVKNASSFNAIFRAKTCQKTTHICLGLPCGKWQLDFLNAGRNVARVKSISSFLTFAVFSAAILVITGCKMLSPAKPASIELFNGKNFDGWSFCMKTNADPTQTWSVSDGVIHCTGQPYGYARTTQAHHDYRLTVVWRFVKVAPHADNTGIFVHTQPPDNVWPVCVECQGAFHHQGDFILHAGVGADGHPAGQKSIPIHQIGEHNEFPAGQWGTNTIVCHGHDIDLLVNGKLMNHLSGCNFSSGYIAIQSEGGDIEVRKLTLQPLQ